MPNFHTSPAWACSCSTVAKAASKERQLLDGVEAAMARALASYRRAARQDQELIAAAERRDVAAVLAIVGTHLEALQDSHSRLFNRAGERSLGLIKPKLSAVVRKARPTVSATFNPNDQRSARIAGNASFRFITDFVKPQLQAVRDALVTGFKQGLGTDAIARLLRRTIGMTPVDAERTARFEAARRAGRAEELALPESERGPIDSDAHLEMLAERYGNNLSRSRAERIARTESLFITSQATDAALRQGIAQTGLSEALTGKQWNSSHDSRTREAHASADGQRRRMSEPFDVGGESIDKPGDGSAGNSINCRCVLTYEFFDTPAELERWLAGGS